MFDLSAWLKTIWGLSIFWKCQLRLVVGPISTRFTSLNEFQDGFASGLGLDMLYLEECGTTWDWWRKYLPASFHDPQLFDVWMSKVRIHPANYEELELIVLGHWAIFIKLLVYWSFGYGGSRYSMGNGNGRWCRNWCPFLDTWNKLGNISPKKISG